MEVQAFATMYVPLFLKKVIFKRILCSNDIQGTNNEPLFDYLRKTHKKTVKPLHKFNLEA